MKAMDLGLRVVIACTACTAVGFWLDRKTGLMETFPVSTLVGFFIGLGAGMLALVKGLQPPDRSGSDSVDGSDDGSGNAGADS